MAWIVFCVVAYLVIVLVIGKSKSPRTIARKRRRALKKRIRRAHKKGQKVDRFTGWWMIHVSIPMGALMLSYRTYKEEMQ